MVCEFIVSAIGFTVIVYAAYKIVTALIRSIFPFQYAVPQNLQVLAGAKWAGEIGISQQSQAHSLLNPQTRLSCSDHRQH